MIIMRTPKGWTCPPVVDGQQVEGTFRAHQVPLPGARTDAQHRRVLQDWLKNYRPEELFDAAGRPVGELLQLVPDGNARMSANPITNGAAPSFGTWRSPTGASTASRCTPPAARNTRRPGCWAAGSAMSQR